MKFSVLSLLLVFSLGLTSCGSEDTIEIRQARAKKLIDDAEAQYSNDQGPKDCYTALHTKSHDIEATLKSSPDDTYEVEQIFYGPRTKDCYYLTKRQKMSGGIRTYLSYHIISLRTEGAVYSSIEMNDNIENGTSLSLTEDGKKIMQDESNKLSLKLKELKSIK